MYYFGKNLMDVISKIFHATLWGRREFLPLPFNFPHCKDCA
jgi:hypothetical protein